jgi:hypothetical protein
MQFEPSAAVASLLRISKIFIKNGINMTKAVATLENVRSLAVSLFFHMFYRTAILPTYFMWQQAN